MASALNTPTPEFWLYVAPTEAERYCMILYCSIFIVVTLVGHTTVLVASIKYKAIKLDKISIILMRNLSVADLGMVGCAVVRALNIIHKDQIFGTVFCVMVLSAFYIFVFYDTTVICALNICKLSTLLFPLRARIRSAQTGHLIAALMWVVISASVLVGGN